MTEVLSPLHARRQRRTFPCTFTNEFCDFILPRVDIFDWGEKSKKDGGGWHRANSTDRLDILFAKKCHEERKFPQRLTPELLQCHLVSKHRIAAAPNRMADVVIILLDVDAHDGQVDSLTAMQWIVKNRFPGAYAERSKRGWHIYLLINSKGITRAEFNARLRFLQGHLRNDFAKQGFQSTVEAIGRFTLLTPEKQIDRRGDMAALPVLPCGSDSLAVLKNSPVFVLTAPEVRDNHSIYTGSQKNRVFEPKSERATQCMRYISSPGAGFDRENAFDRMRMAGWLLAGFKKRVPTIDELLRFYKDYFFAGISHAARDQRAKGVVRYLERKFDPARCIAGFYSESKQSLELVVSRNCPSPPKGISYEDLIIGLHTVTVASFTQHTNPKRQFTVPNAAITGMFRALGVANLSNRGGASRRKIIAIKKALLSARLIECIDSRYIPGGKDRGVGKKYTIGPDHPRYAQFCRFAEGVPVKYVGDKDVTRVQGVAQ